MNFSKKDLKDLSPAEADIINELSNLYTGLEFIASHDSDHLSSVGKGNVRRAQAGIQRVRLKLLDLFKEKRDKP